MKYSSKWLSFGRLFTSGGDMIQQWSENGVQRSMATTHDQSLAPKAVRVAIVTPVLDDWRSLQRLVAEIDKTGRHAGFRVTIFAIDDGSSIAPPVLEPPAEGSVDEVHVIRLVRNLGHQRAIAVELVEVYRSLSDHDFSTIVVMDSDGEDPPADIPALVQARLPLAFAVNATTHCTFESATLSTRGCTLCFAIVC